MELSVQIHLFTYFLSFIKVYAQVVLPVKHPGLQVLATASHYWPLDAVDGIHELWDKIGNRPGYVNGSNITLRIHNHTVLPSSHNSSYVYTNDSAYTNISATVDIVEGMVNKGIFLNGDNGGTFLHFGKYQNSCISDPSWCGPEGITFSFFWKNHESESRFAVASGGKVISNGFSVYTNHFGGYVEFYTRANNHRWKANIKVPGPYWTHILFTWTVKDGLKVFINGTFTAGDTDGSVSDNYGDPYPDLVIGTGNDRAYGHYVTGAFDEFVIWERALPPREISLYYGAATGQSLVSATTPKVSEEVTSTAPTVRSTEVSPPVVSRQHKEDQSSQDPESLPVLGFLTALPNKTIPYNTANNLTQAFLKSVEEVLSSPGLPEQQSIPVVSGLIETVDRVMEHMVTNLEPSPNALISLGGQSFIADYSLMKFPQNYNLQHYRFPKLGKSYISVPGEAFTMQSQTTIVGLFYHNMHNYYKEISPVKTRINEASDFKDHKIQVASYLISLKVEPSPALSVNLSGAPLIKIVLTHILVPLSEGQSHVVGVRVTSKSRLMPSEYTETADEIMPFPAESVRAEVPPSHIVWQGVGLTPRQGVIKAAGGPHAFSRHWAKALIGPRL
ncbi:hypothetical protein KUCAC02_028501 [Chaenocephalus aceratus]|uniref:Uncharacterized protein n=1 Tax=Chaenocephalus aceratus TaxID=36190 RepID=A0ACB9X283_CHAAC|nr:hypothetical protein KUCAC02_028501 [Chaenocephalus aceratus]